MINYIKTWLKGLSERTKENYLREFKTWLEFVDMKPEEQIKKRMQNHMKE